MSGQCCGEKKFDGISDRYKRVLWIVIALNAGMFITEVIGGVLAQSQALQADALDFLADSLTYALSLWAIGRPIAVRSRVAWLKGVSLSLMGLWVLLFSVYRFFVVAEPEPFTMGWIALLALAVNLISVLLLLAYRNGDANVRSVWLCSRNDAIGNIAVMIAAAGVWWTGAAWPDLVVAILMALLFLNSSWQILAQVAEEREAHSMSDSH